MRKWNETFFLEKTKKNISEGQFFLIKKIDIFFNRYGFITINSAQGNKKIYYYNFLLANQLRQF